MQPTRYDVFMFYDSQVSVLSSDYGKQCKEENKLISALLTLARIHVVLTDELANVKKILVKLYFSLIQVSHGGVTICLGYQHSHCPPQSI